MPPTTPLYKTLATLVSLLTTMIMVTSCSSSATGSGHSNVAIKDLLKAANDPSKVAGMCTDVFGDPASIAKRFQLGQLYQRHYLDSSKLDCGYDIQPGNTDDSTIDLQVGPVSSMGTGPNSDTVQTVNGIVAAIQRGPVPTGKENDFIQWLRSVASAIKH